jgi:hypothetical protein
MEQPQRTQEGKTDKLPQKCAKGARPNQQKSGIPFVLHMLFCG